MPERLGNPGEHVAASDWLFIGEDMTPPQNIPEPGSLALLGSGLAAGLARRRKARSDSPILADLQNDMRCRLDPA